MSPYRYQGVPLTPAVIAELILELHDVNSANSRQDMIATVSEEHERRGGMAARGNIAGATKKALAMLLEEGRVESVAYGYWRITPPLDPDEVKEPVELGDGAESVYVYYFPAYRDQAAHLRRDAWPMKIGMTKGQPEFRIKEQSGTSMPEQPIVGMIYRTKNASNSEKMLHSTLKERNRYISGAPGKEWFMTSLAEVRSILDFVNQR